MVTMNWSCEHHFDFNLHGASQTFVLCITTVQFYLRLDKHEGEEEEMCFPTNGSPVPLSVTWNNVCFWRCWHEDQSCKCGGEFDRVCSYLSPLSLIYRHTPWCPSVSPSDARRLTLATSALEIPGDWCRVGMFSLHKWPESLHVPVSPASVLLQVTIVFIHWNVSNVCAFSTKDLSSHLATAHTMHNGWY